MQTTSFRVGSGLRVVLQRRSVTCFRVAASTRQTAKPTASPAVPTVGDTKRKFRETYRRPVPAIYDTVIQELLVQQHFVRYNSSYQYNEVFALGFVSVFDQVLEGLDAGQRAEVFDAYITALGEDPARYRADAEQLERDAKALSGASDLRPDAGGSALQRALAALADASAAERPIYNKLLAIGLFRLLELVGAKEPATLERLAKDVGARPEAVNRDLLLYKGVLSKLAASKELMREFLEREKRKNAERLDEKVKREEEVANAPARV